MKGNGGIILATLFVGFLTAGVALYTHFYPSPKGLKPAEVERQDEKSKSEEPKPSPSLNFADVFVTPVDTKMPSTFYLEITNTGTAPAKDIDLTVDFGEATADKCEWIPSREAKSEDKSETVVRTFDISLLPRKESFYLVCATNIPIFKSITIGGGNSDYKKQLTFQAYQDQRDGRSISFYEGFVRTVLGVFAAMVLIYFFFKIMSTLG